MITDLSLYLNMKHLFIIPVHESNECLADTIANVVKFNPDITPYFVLYISDYFTDFDDARFTADNILITKRLRRHTGYHYESQLESLIKAYNLACEKWDDFEYVSVFHTSQLFLKFGYAEYIKNYDFTYDETTWVADGQTLPRYRPIFDHEVMRPILGDDYRNTNHYCYQMVEKGVYRKPLFDLIAKACVSGLSRTLTQLTDIFAHTPIEEIVIPTLAKHFSDQFPKMGANPTLQHLPIDAPYSLSPAQFSVKSVPRDMNHKLRVEARNKLP